LLKNQIYTTVYVLRCEQSILSVVNARNCIQFYQLGEELNAKSLKDYCSSLVSMHWVKFFYVV